ncbi:Ribosomal silencing factor RsfS [Chlamydiales bacterium STE3]|nr:Ribosomal silencing factor RsfS [Chlamydiales bacterium STE3]
MDIYFLEKSWTSSIIINYTLANMKNPDLIRLDEIAQTIFDKKGLNILALDVREISTFTEYYLIAEGNVDRHVVALARAVIDQQSIKGHPPFHIEGTATGDWVVIDFGHIVVHLFHPDLREKYALERLWNSGSIIDLTIQTGSS